MVAVRNKRKAGTKTLQLTPPCQFSDKRSRNLPQIVQNANIEKRHEH
jgi:hypothetical protein